MFVLDFVVELMQEQSRVILRQGYLMKRGRWLRGWKRAYVVLSQDGVRVYDNDEVRLRCFCPSEFVCSPFALRMHEC